MRKALPVVVVMLGFTGLFLVGTGLTSVVAAQGQPLLLNESQILYLSSTSAQVVAAVYGLTLTGFIFFRGELSREGVEDETLRDAVEALKARYYLLLVFITVLVIVTLLLANLTIVWESVEGGPLRRFFLNGGQVGFVTSLLAIAYFVFDVISPERIERASKSLQVGVDPHVEGQTAGSLDDFLKNYEQIQAALDGAANDYLGNRPTDERRRRRRLPNDRLIEILYRSQRIDRTLRKTLRDLITLNNAIIHGADPVVSEEIVKASAQALQDLKTALERPIERRPRLGRR